MSGKTTSVRTRTTIALIIFVSAWCGGWPIGYLITGNSDFLWMGPAVLAGSALGVAAEFAVLDWIHRGEDR